MKNRYTIGELSKLFNFSTQTLRYYDRIGLFKPKLIDEKNGYRYYTYEQFQDLRTIIYLKHMGISLKKINKHLLTKDAKHLLNILEERKDLIELEISNLSYTHRQLDTKINNIKKALYGKELNKVTIKNFPERYIYSINLDFKANEISKYLEMLITEIFSLKNKYPKLIVENCGIKISKKNLKEKNFDMYNSIFMLQNKPYNKIIETIPSGSFACIYHKGPYEEIHKKYQIITNYIAAHNYSINSDGFEIASLDTKFTNRKEDYLTEIQIPII